MGNITWLSVLLEVMVTCSRELVRKCDFFFGKLIILKASTIQMFCVYNVLSTVQGVLRSHNQDR